MSSSIVKGILNYKTKFNNVQPIGPLNSFQQQNDNREKIDDYYLKIQIASSKNRIPLKSYNFKGLKEIKSFKIRKYFSILF